MLAAEKGYPAEVALDYIELGRSTDSPDQRQEETKEMIRLKEQGWTYRRIGEKFGMSQYAVYARIRRYQERI